MKTTVDFRADNEGNIVEITTTTYTPDEWLAKSGEVYRFAQMMGAKQAGYISALNAKKIATYTDIANMDDTDRKIEAMYGVKLGD